MLSCHVNSKFSKITNINYKFLFSKKKKFGYQSACQNSKQGRPWSESFFSILCLHCLSRPVWQAISVHNFKTYVVVFKFQCYVIVSYVIFFYHRSQSIWIQHHSPHNEAQSISELNRFLYFLISGVSDEGSVIGCEGVTFTLICEPRRDWPDTDWPKIQFYKENLTWVLMFYWIY